VACLNSDNLGVATRLVMAERGPDGILSNVRIRL
jgi:hypothetical protein